MRHCPVKEYRDSPSGVVSVRVALWTAPGAGGPKGEVLGRGGLASTRGQFSKRGGLEVGPDSEAWLPVLPTPRPGGVLSGHEVC